MDASEINIENFPVALIDAQRRLEALRPLVGDCRKGHPHSTRLDQTVRTALESLERIQSACEQPPLPPEVDRWLLFTRLMVDGDAEPLPDNGLAENIVRLEYIFRRL